MKAGAWLGGMIGGCLLFGGLAFSQTDERKSPEAAYRAPAGVKFIADVPYREGNKAWMVDIAMPAESNKTPRAAVLAVHGGGWTAGDKNGQRVMINRLAQHGYVGVGVRYRLTGEAPFSACIEDVKCATRWLRAHAEDYNIDPNRIGAFGHSAGAHLVAMLGVAPKSAGLDDGPWMEQSSLANAVCAIATPTDLTNGRERRRFESEEEAKRCSPITYASAEAPPFLLIQGTKDTTVNPQQPKDFADSLQAAGAKNVNLILLDGLGHDPLPSHESILLPMMLAFFDTTIGDQAGLLDRQVEMAGEYKRLRGTGYGFDKVAAFDKSSDGRISLGEFAGTGDMFARLDRNADGYIEPKDMTRQAPRSAPASRTSLAASD